MAGDVLWADQGSYAYSPKLSKRLFYDNQPVMRFRNFCDVKKALGTNKGEKVNFDKIADVTTQGGTLTETNTVPTTKFDITQSSVTVAEWGNSISSTKKYRTLNEIDLKGIISKSLKVDAAKTIDEAAAQEFHRCLLRYVATSTDAVVTLTTDGTATATNTSVLNKYHFKNIVDEMVSRNMPTYDGQNFVMVGSPKSIRGIFDSIEPLAAYRKDVRALPGEVGRYYDTRIVRASWGLGENWRAKRAAYQPTGVNVAAGAWASVKSDEAFFFGQETVMECIALMEQIRSEERDLGRQHILGWYALLAYKIVWGETADADNAKIIKWDSKA